MIAPLDPETQELALQHARQRRADVRGWGAVLAFILLCGLTGWLITRDVAWLAVCGVLAPYPVLMLLYTLVYLLNPWASPATTQRRLIAAARARQRAPARAAFGNGILFVAASPFLFVIAVVGGIEDGGLWGGICGALFGFAWLALGVGMIVWAKRS